MSEARRRRIVVTRLEPLGKPFKRQNGSTGQTLKVHATTVEGVPINERLKAFSRLPVGEEIDVEVRPDDHPQYGRSYIVSMPGGRVGRELHELAQRVQAIEERLGIGRRVAERRCA